MSYGLSQFVTCKLFTNDIEATADFYEAVCGMQRSAPVHAEIAGRKIMEYWFSYPDGRPCSFLVMTYLDGPTVTGNDSCFVFLTDDVAAFRERVLTHGGKVLQEAIDFPEVNVRCLFVTDIEGHNFEAVQPIDPAKPAGEA